MKVWIFLLQLVGFVCEGLVQILILAFRLFVEELNGFLRLILRFLVEERFELVRGLFLIFAFLPIAV